MRAFVLIFLFITSFSFAQKVEIISIESNDRLLRGHIADEYPITMYLKVAHASDNVGYIYSVQGWYQYDKVGTPIPLSGIWTGSELHLFTSDDSKFLQNILNFTYDDGKEKKYLDNYLYELESFTAKLPEVKERFHLKFEEHRITGDWKSNGKRFWVSINGSNRQIVKEVDYLKLPNGSYFELSNLGIPSRADFEILASANNGKNLILNYAYHANLNYNGRCGGATTSGKVGLVFDHGYQLSSYTNAEFENCYIELSVDDLQKISESVTHYKIIDYSSNNTETYIVDTKNATLKKEKKKD
jgi:hypothetical protein